MFLGTGCNSQVSHIPLNSMNSPLIRSESSRLTPAALRFNSSSPLLAIRSWLEPVKKNKKTQGYAILLAQVIQQIHTRQRQQPDTEDIHAQEEIALLLQHSKFQAVGNTLNYERAKCNTF